jgi:hypothetical protein
MDAAPRLSQYKQSPKVDPAMLLRGAAKLVFKDLQDCLTHKLALSPAKSRVPCLAAIAVSSRRNLLVQEVP